MGKLASLFGYLLNYVYSFCNNYGLAIIIFTILFKVISLPASISQQRTMKKTSKIQKEAQILQEKYKNDPVRLNQETMNLYKKENVSPFGGCLFSIVQIFVVLAMFYLVSQPLTYMKKIDSEIINNYINQIVEKNPDVRYREIAVIKEFGNSDSTVNLNMNFLGLDLSDVPSQNYTNWKVYIIPVLYVMTSIVSMKIINKQNEALTKNKDNKNDKINEIAKDNKNDDNINEKEIKENSKVKDLVEKKDESKEDDMMSEMNKNMSIMMPAMSVMIAMIAPLGLALYWLISNLFNILERIFINKILEKKEEEKTDE